MIQLHLRRWSNGGEFNHAIQPHPEVQEFAHGRRHVEDWAMDVESVQIGADHVRLKAILESSCSNVPLETSRSVTHIKQDTTSCGRLDGCQHVTGFIQDRC